MTYNPDSEAALEAAVMNTLATLGYAVVDAYDEINGSRRLGRENLDEVVLLSRLIPALERLNPDMPQSALEIAVETLLADHSLATPAHANAEVYTLLKNGVRVTFKDANENDISETVRLIDWDNPDNNDWLAVQQFWVLNQSELYKRRASFRVN